jgi:AcrR family transcriptional regulator
MPAIQTARERARTELTREIKAEAGRRLAAAGASGLSLRAVARELGMASSALYRYFPSRDHLLTALIIDAYNALGDQTEAADRSVPPDHFRARLHTVCSAVRTWAIDHPNEYALVYGSPVPGYQAPEDTIVPGSRVAMLLLALLNQAWSANALTPRPEPVHLSAELAEQTKTIADFAGLKLPAPDIARGAMVWTQLFGLISFEVFGQFANSLDPADAFFHYTVERMADLLGLPAETDQG